MAKVVTPNVPVHWSKDFVDHLRTVHFALIAIAVGLAVLVLSSRQYNAISALVEIEEILDLKHHWSPAWMEQFGEEDKSSKSTHNNLDSFLDENSHVSWKDPGFDGLIHWTEREGRRSLDRPVTVACVFPKENWYQSGFDWSPTTFPETLSEFKGWWETLGKSYVIYLPDQIANSGRVEDLVASLKNQKEVSVGNFRAGSSESQKFKIQLLLDPDHDHGPTEDSAEQSFSYIAYLDDDNVLTIPILSLTRHVVTRETISRHYHNLHAGDFQDTFADLAKASEAMSDLSLQDIKEFIHDEAAKGPEVFEVFGMKFPAGQVTLWGIILLLSVELYFFTYLKLLAGKLGPDDPGWDVPWIGMDASKLAQSIFFVTVVPLPVAALTLLAVRRGILVFVVPSAKSTSFLALLRSLSLGETAEILALLVACVTSLALALLCWKFRPQLIMRPQALPNAAPSAKNSPIVDSAE